MPSINELEKFATKTAKKAGQKLFDTFRRQEPLIRGTSKEIKTIYDEVADKTIRKSIEKSFPDHSYLTEEAGYTKKGSDYLWVVDPLDGTGNFVNHNPLFAVSIALWKKGEPVLGVIEAPTLQERFAAVAGKGAWHYDSITKKKKPARVSQIKNLKQSYVIYCEGSEENRRWVSSLLSRIYPQVKEFRKLGAASLELAWVGLGRSEGYVTTKIHFYDIAAGVIFVHEAGGKIFDHAGRPYRLNELGAKPEGQFDLLVTNSKVELKV